MGNVARDMREIATKWNILNPPVIQGRIEYDELLLGKHNISYLHVVYAPASHKK